MRFLVTLNGFFTLMVFGCMFMLASYSSPNTVDAVAQVDQLSVLDPVDMTLHNLSDPLMSLNESTKVPLIEEEATQAEEKKDSLAIFFILFVLFLSILVVHVLIITEFHYCPESLAIVLLGALIGLILSYSKWDWRDVETFNPNFFFLVLLPPIIFESGYNLHKGNFFANIVPILVFAIIGTAISAFIMGFGIYALGEVDAQLYMLAFGESMLNDAVAIVLATTALEMSNPEIIELSGMEMTQYAFYRFLSMFFTSAFLGAACGFISALLFKHIDLRRTPSLEFALLIVFAYLPYGLAEAISLSDFNISSITQITMQQTFRTLAFVAETCTFAYLGLALFTIKLVFQPIFLVYSIEKLENKQKFRNIAFEALRSAATNDSSSDELLFNSSTSVETAQPLLPK
ncbi:sodium-hydrogen exchanger NHE1 [Aphelenchoides avenae]|nr:sodium-hydrogen exchanger NHE1 [Aphelenchus avenae]